MPPTFGNFCPQLLGNWEFLSPTFGDFCPQLLWIWEFLSPKVGDKNSQTVGDNNSIPMGIIIVPNFSHRNLFIVPNFFGWEKLGTKIPQRLGTKIPKSPKVGAKNSQIPKSWGHKFPKVGDKNSQKLGTKNPKSWGQKIPNPQKLGTKIPKSWGQ